MMPFEDSKQSVRVVLPWSTWATMQTLQIFMRTNFNEQLEILSKSRHDSVNSISNSNTAISNSIKSNTAVNNSINNSNTSINSIKNLADNSNNNASLITAKLLNASDILDLMDLLDKSPSDVAKLNALKEERIQILDLLQNAPKNHVLSYFDHPQTDVPTCLPKDHLSTCLPKDHVPTCLPKDRLSTCLPKDHLSTYFANDHVPTYFANNHFPSDFQPVTNSPDALDFITKAPCQISNAQFENVSNMHFDSLLESPDLNPELPNSPQLVEIVDYKILKSSSSSSPQNDTLNASNKVDLDADLYHDLDFDDFDNIMESEQRVLESEQRVLESEPAKQAIVYPWTNEVNKILRQIFHLHDFRINQKEIIDSTLSGNDCFVLMVLSAN